MHSSHLDLITVNALFPSLYCSTTKISCCLNAAARAKNQEVWSRTVLASLHWLHVLARTDFKILVLTYKASHGSAYLWASHILYQDAHLMDIGLQTTSEVQKQSAGHRPFAFHAPSVWNGVPSQVTERGSVDTFKSGLKVFLFCTHYNWVYIMCPPDSRDLTVCLWYLTDHIFSCLRLFVS